MSDLATLKTNHAAAQDELKSRQAALNEVVAAVTAQGKKPEKAESVKIFTQMVEDSKANVEKLAKQIESAERAERTRTVVDPLLENFGTLTVDAAKDFKLEFVDIESTLNTLQDSIKGVTSKIAAINHLKSVMDALAIGEDTAADLKAVRFEAVAPNQYKLTMARAGGTRTGGTRASSSTQIFTITKANDAHAALVGRKIGKGQDFESWRALLEATDPDLFKKLEDKRTDAAGTGKKSNYSASVVAAKQFGVEFSSEAAPTAA